ncbi:MAG: bifunctional riboflavin kinase/FMN adenylyltransferase, partial [Acetatifactor sp.]|nr:bifunctional riboflavin kinase/FMN adenylyltransferase [Acetatifactor sp.]
QIIEKIRRSGREGSSTYVRSRVESGHMGEAARLLGTPYTVSGTVCRGAGLGHTLAMPTVNLQPPAEKLLPPFGVYFSQVMYRGTCHKAISNVGCKPTVTDAGCAGVETYLYDFDRDIYGEEIQVQLLAFHRPEQRFDSVDALKRQLQADMEAGRRFWNQNVRLQ